MSPYELLVFRQGFPLYIVVPHLNSFDKNFNYDVNENKFYYISKEAAVNLDINSKAFNHVDIIDDSWPVSYVKTHTSRIVKLHIIPHEQLETNIVASAAVETLFSDLEEGGADGIIFISSTNPLCIKRVYLHQPEDCIFNTFEEMDIKRDKRNPEEIVRLDNRNINKYCIGKF